MENLRWKLAKVWSFGANFGSTPRFESHLEDDDDFKWKNFSVVAKIVGFEILEKEKKLTVG